MQIWWVNGKDRYVLFPDSEKKEALLLSKEDVNLRLRLEGIDSHKRPGGLHSHADIFIRFVQENRAVAWAGVVAGMKTGIHEANGLRLAVLRSFRLIEPQDGDCRVIRRWLETAFQDDGASQLNFFLAWLRTAYEALRDGVRRPGYILFLIGPSDCGKNLLQEEIITPILGGRSTNPLPHLRDRDNFNDDVCGVEHQMISELKGCKLDGQSRAELGEALKDLAVNSVVRLRAQYSSSMMVPVWRRVSLSMNDEPDRLKAAPALTSDFADKVLMLLCRRADLTYDTSTPGGWQRLGDTIREELPAFLHWLLNEWSMPEALSVGSHVGRFGFTNYQHPVLKEALFAQTPESQLLYIIDRSALFPRDEFGRPTAWGWAKSEDLRIGLCAHAHDAQLFGAAQVESHNESREDARKLFYYPGATGTLLRKLANRDPKRFLSKHDRKEGNFWMILPPET